ncbi:DNA cytosine methyltransferase [Chryseobacterium vrystaatense]|uniref:Cytosine-specific methyltransferase n=1 Tax=Chryseobacterium vrystaatense TaxID=307480 RepID=A0A1M4ZH78_9FLAO|nr:DNA (cytosine-5-)-methyltransferase [Chryseobacterium vrystaatense]SHF17400.1 DNA (cytosine-5)-methyltransferase 1 [Chryseobacterium vrystaatense]
MTHGSLFSGVGGFDLAAELADIKTLWNSEIKNYQSKILETRFKDTINYGDIKAIKPAQLQYVNIISGGFPCQDISAAKQGAEGITGKRSSLWGEMFRIVSARKPEYIIIENSDRLLTRGFEYILYDLSKIGYNAEWKVIQSKDFGYFHNRKRLYVVAHRLCDREQGLFQDFCVSEMRQRWENRKAHFEDYIAKEDFTGRFESQIKPLLYGNSYGVPNWVERIESIGNAVIPEIAYYIFECIKMHRFNAVEK